ncbi:MAG: metallophosphoesterase [SAR324 cluster bacterium]|nr:metallophosphoesterase [SAR324 cluster bacterium]
MTKKIFLVTLLLVLGGWSGCQIHQEFIRKGCFPLSSDITKSPITTVSPTSLKFIAVGDVGTGNKDQKQVAETIYHICHKKGCDLILMLGDNFYPDGVASPEDPLFTTVFENMYTRIDKPFFAVVGNHDLHQSGLSQIMYSLKNPRWNMPNFSYYFEAGPARFFAVNTECNLWGLHELEVMLDGVSSPSPWSFVFTHRPIYSSGTHGDTDPVMRWYWQQFLQDKIDFYLAGHDHELEHLQKPGKATEYIVSGAGGQHYRSPKDRERTTSSEIPSLFIFQNTGFAWFDVKREKVHMQFIDGEGHVLYEFSKRKN